jgi:hypothetical protein
VTAYLKAVVAALVAGLGALGTALADNQVAPVEWVAVAVATLVAGGAVWRVPNAGPAPAEHRAGTSNVRRVVDRDEFPPRD